MNKGERPAGFSPLFFALKVRNTVRKRTYSFVTTLTMPFLYRILAVIRHTGIATSTIATAAEVSSTPAIARAAVSTNGIIPIQWSIDTLDWKGIGAKEIVSRVLSKAGSGKIVLMHNNSDNVEKALPVLIDRLKKKNLQVTSVGDLIYKENYQVNRFGIMKKC